MELTVYKENIINKMCLETPDYLKQRLINELRKNNIADYNSKDSKVINISNMTKKEKIEQCVKCNNRTLQFIDLLEVKKGYRYTILFQYKDLNFEKFIEALKIRSKDISGDYYNKYKDEVVEDEYLFWETDNELFIKFHKMIDIIDKKAVEKKYIRYPIVFVFHKDVSIFECRFDRLSYNNDYSFYKTTMDARISTLQSIIKFEYNFLDLENIIKYMVDNKKDFIKEIVWSFETAKSKALTLRVGEDGVMPFIDEIEILINKLKNTNKDKLEVLNVLKEIESYIETTKRFANEKFRILSLMKYEDENGIIELEDCIEFKITFGYCSHSYDLINIYENEINDMERINYVIKFIGKVGENINQV